MHSFVQRLTFCNFFTNSKLFFQNNEKSIYLKCLFGELCRVKERKKISFFDLVDLSICFISQLYTFLQFWLNTSSIAGKNAFWWQTNWWDDFRLQFFPKLSFLEKFHVQGNWLCLPPITFPLQVHIDSFIGFKDKWMRTFW